EFDPYSDEPQFILQSAQRQIGATVFDPYTYDICHQKGIDYHWRKEKPLPKHVPSQEELEAKYKREHPMGCSGYRLSAVPPHVLGYRFLKQTPFAVWTPRQKLEKKPTKKPVKQSLGLAFEARPVEDGDYNMMKDKHYEDVRGSCITLNLQCTALCHQQSALWLMYVVPLSVHTPSSMPWSEARLHDDWLCGPRLIIFSYIVWADLHPLRQWQSVPT
ncbi:hypothetical protein DAEQUDRAFT_742143, partial [Daedalea quercina L-15889]